MLNFAANTDLCKCSDNCSGRTRRYFAQGHDARLVARLRDEVAQGLKTRQEAVAECSRRGGSMNLINKLQRAIDNTSSRKGKKRVDNKKADDNRKVEVIEVDGHRLWATPKNFAPVEIRKVGRWVYKGSLGEHRIEGGESSDTMLVFSYQNKKGEQIRTVKHANASSR